MKLSGNSGDFDYVSVAPFLFFFLRKKCLRLIKVTKNQDIEIPLRIANSPEIFIHFSSDENNAEWNLVPTAGKVSQTQSETKSMIFTNE